jgi:hypothetical protein
MMIFAPTVLRCCVLFFPVHKIETKGFEQMNG